jgi:hypothetical protein
MTKAESRLADGTASAAPKDVPGQNTFEITRRQRRKQAATAKPRRPIRPETWSSLRAAIVRQHQALPPGSPRVRPTLPRLRWLEPAEVA